LSEAIPIALSEANDGFRFAQPILQPLPKDRGGVNGPYAVIASAAKQSIDPQN
jgi:hypothetical protein